VLGTWGFRALDVVVDGRALVPRPETEQLVDVALGELGGRSGRDGRRRDRLVALDLGTGSGVIALSLAHEGPASLEVWATERSLEALALARCNLERLAADSPDAAARVHLRAGSWFEPLPWRLRGEVDLVVSNPPYVARAEWEQLDAVVRDHDPYAALVPGPTGLEALAEIVDESFDWLAPGGSLAVELAPWQADEVRGRASARGYADAATHPDLTGRPRFVVARRPPA
jgi:release factor glutamine methyltransferase